MLSDIRNGNFTSSEIVALTKRNKNGDDFGESALKYINQCNMERRLGRSLDGELDARPVMWGRFLESLLFSMLQEEYTYNSSQTLVHPKYPWMVGTPDGYKKAKKRTVVDTKCPWTLESFCNLVNPLYDGLEGLDAMNALRNGYTDKNGLNHAKHLDGEKYYWQLVSNACIDDCECAELIVYCPFESELEVIISQAVKSGEPSAYFIANGNKNTLPNLIDGGFYNNINVISFEVPTEDKEFLTELVEKAGKYLITT